MAEPQANQVQLADLEMLRLANAAGDLPEVPRCQGRVCLWSAVYLGTTQSAETTGTRRRGKRLVILGLRLNSASRYGLAVAGSLPASPTFG